MISTSCGQNRRGAHLQNVRSALEIWRYQLLLDRYSPSPVTCAVLLPDPVLTSLASNVNLKTVDDLSVLTPPWIYASRHGQEALDLLQRLDSDERQERERAVQERREGKKQKTRERQEAKRQQMEIERAQKKTQKEAVRWEREERIAQEREAHRLDKEFKRQAENICLAQEKQAKQVHKELTRMAKRPDHSTLVSGSMWNSVAAGLPPTPLLPASYPSTPVPYHAIPTLNNLLSASYPSTPTYQVIPIPNNSYPSTPINVTHLYPANPYHAVHALSVPTTVESYMGTSSRVPASSPFAPDGAVSQSALRYHTSS